MKNRTISNLVCYQGQWMTLNDMKLRLAYKMGRKADILPRRVNGKIVGYYVLNESGETAIATI